MNRRGFLKSILAAGVAPAFVGSSVLMPVRALLTATLEEVTFLQSGSGAHARTVQEALRLYGDGVTDDTAAMQAWLNGEPVWGPAGTQMGRVLLGGSYRISNTLWMGGNRPMREMLHNTFIGPVKDGPMIHYTPQDDGPLPISGAQMFSI